MPIVSLKRDWFDPEGKIWHARNNPHEMDAELIDALPSDAVVDGVPRSAEKASKKADMAAELEAQKQGLEEKKREEKVLQKAESEHNDKSHAASVLKSATPPKTI